MLLASSLESAPEQLHNPSDSKIVGQPRVSSVFSAIFGSLGPAILDAKN